MNRMGIQFGAKDCWSLDCTLSPILLSALLKFKEVSKGRKGVPVTVLSDLFPECLYSHTEEQLEKGSEAWEEIIDKMIFAFDKKNEPKIEDYNFTFVHTFDDPMENGSRRAHITNTNEDEYERYKKDEVAYQSRVEEGHMLFGKYFQNLWY